MTKGPETIPVNIPHRTAPHQGVPRYLQSTTSMRRQTRQKHSAQKPVTQQREPWVGVKSKPSKPLKDRNQKSPQNQTEIKKAPKRILRTASHKIKKKVPAKAEELAYLTHVRRNIIAQYRKKEEQMPHWETGKGWTPKSTVPQPFSFDSRPEQFYSKATAKNDSQVDDGRDCVINNQISNAETEREIKVATLESMVPNQWQLQAAAEKWRELIEKTSGESCVKVAQEVNELQIKQTAECPIKAQETQTESPHVGDSHETTDIEVQIRERLESAITKALGEA